MGYILQRLAEEYWEQNGTNAASGDSVSLNMLTPSDRAEITQFLAQTGTGRLEYNADEELATVHITDGERDRFREEITSEFRNVLSVLHDYNYATFIALCKQAAGGHPLSQRDRNILDQTGLEIINNEFNDFQTFDIVRALLAASVIKRDRSRVEFDFTRTPWNIPDFEQASQEFRNRVINLHYTPDTHTR